MKFLCRRFEEFTDEEVGQLCNYSRELYTTTDFDEEVERELENLEAEKQRRVSPPARPSNLARQHDK